MLKASGLRHWLRVPLVYNLFQDAIGGNAFRQRFIKDHVRARTGDKIVDIGCGPAQVLSWLPATQYVGLDVSEAYIASAKRKYADRGTFVRGDTKTVWDDPRFYDADIVTAFGILHHMNDEEATHCLRFAYHILKERGRFLSFDGCRVPNQEFLSKYFMSRDRGRNIRTEEAYCDLARSVFQNVHSWVDMRPLRIPYVIVVLECTK